MAHIKTSRLSDEEKELMSKNYISWQQGQEYVRVEPGRCTLPIAYEKLKDKIYNWPLGDGDVFVFGWVKTGTTWAREMVWCLLNDCQLEKAKQKQLNERIPFIDMAVIADFDGNCEKELGLKSEEVIDKLRKLPSPKTLKSHLPFDLFPPDLLDKSKVVMCLRNPKDTLVSYYHHEKLLKLHGFTGTFADYFDIFMRNLMIYGDYFEYATTAWKKRDHPNMCIIFYEEMKKDLSAVVKKVGKFLKKEVTEEQVEKLVEHLSFKTMKNNKTVNNEAIRGVAFVPGQNGSFIRKGEVGDWKNYFTDEMNKKMDAEIDRRFKGIGLEFEYE
ncbi:sulfotransferase 1B1-like [Rhopilema esculentum]|uniref:sulfotransferase 1B1-like n=1 Tax=Rhopilema esculentum TaxID=499914 RepID=UPI0031D523A3|eukprot:gene940-10700_t